MRNLQKILALALALIMSFSLVVTANAAFSDEADISEAYNESVDVLSTLEVFKGYTDGTYQPQKSITRAEVAAIIYRIATGDVADEQVAIYSDWNRFTDVHAGEWWAGYINYCANAEYIKGYGNGKFGPDDPVTGYEALAMILRAVGYGKMDGEFQGSDWAVQTAARASTLKVTKNVQNSALLNSPATRELVAELLFRSILVPTVEYNQFSGYSENDTTLGYQSFKLEAIEGVVVANEYANLYDIQVLDAGKTDFEVAKDDVRSLNIGSELTDIGEAHYAYVSGSTVYALENTGDNVVFEPENGKATKIEGSNFQKNTGLKKDDNTEFYLNFGREGNFSCDYRLEFSIEFKGVDGKSAEEIRKEFEADYKVNLCLTDDADDPAAANADPSVDAQMLKMAYADLEHAEKDKDGNEIGTTIGYELIIRANEKINEAQLKAIKGIFAAADDDDLSEGIAGAVYIGTKSTKDDANINRYKDASDEMSYRTFYNDYINSEIWDQDIENSGNGEWLKIVDNDGDGIAEYAFKTEYWMDKAISSYTKSGETILEFNSVDVEGREDDDGIVDIAEGIAVGDVVYYTDIDNRVTMTKAPVVTAQIKSISFKDDTCTTTEDETYTESDIYNRTRLDQKVENMDDEVRYNLYFDAYGYLRVYELADGNKYGLLTELYKTTTQNVQYITGEDLTVELKKGSEKLDEFGVSNSKDNVFLLSENNTDGTANWKDLHDNLWTDYTDNRTILLQPAAGQLGEVSLTRNSIFAHPKKAENATYATTNVAVYTETADGEVRLTSPVKPAKDTNGDRYYYVDTVDLTGEKDTTVRLGAEAYEVDYIALDLSAGVKADAKHYPISASSRYAKQSNGNSNYVDAVHDTEFYVVNTNSQKVDYFTDYEKVYELKAEDITAAYAVARNTVADLRDSDYWVADVIVIEVKNVDTIYDSVGILFNNPSQVSGSVKRIETLNTESENPEIDMILDSGRFDWAPRYNGNWAYEIDEKELKDGDLYADEATPINENYNDKGLYAGTVSRIRDIRDRGGYIDILMHGVDKDGNLLAAAAGRPVPNWREGINVTNEIIFAIGSNKGNAYANTTLRDLRLTESTRVDRLDEDHRVVWGEDKDGHVAFVIDVDFVDGDWYAPDWVEDLWTAIVEEQITKKQAWTFAEALEAFLTWQRTQDPEDKANAVTAVAGALKNNAITGNDRERLEEMDAILNGGATTPSGEVSGVPVSKDETAGINVLGITQEPNNTDKNNGALDLYVRDKNLTTIQMLQNALRSSVSGENLTVQGIQADGSVAPMDAYVDRMSSIKVIISKGDASKTYTATIKANQNSYVILTLGEGVRAYSDEAHKNELLTGAIKAETATTIYLVASGAGYFKVNADGSVQELKPTDNSAAYSSSKDETYSSITTSPGTSASSNVKVDFVKEAKVDGSAEFEIKASVSATLEKKSDTEYVVYMKHNATLPNAAPTVGGAECGPGKDIISVKNETGLVAGSLAWLNFHKVSSTGSEAVYTYYARGIYGGENTTYTFTFIKASEAAPAATVTSVNGFNATDNASDGKKVTITDATVITADMVEVENGTLIGLFVDEHGATPMEKVPVVDNSVFYAGILGTDKATISYVKVTINPNP